MNKKLTLFLTAVFLLISFGTASALPLYNNPNAGVAGTKFEDDNLDYFEDNDNNGIISQGDVLYSAVEFTKILDISGGGAPAYSTDLATDELVAWAEIQVTSTVGPAWTFGQNGANPMISVYTGGAINLDVLAGDPTLAQAEAAVKDGTFLWSFSITANPATFWAFTPIDPDADDPSVVATLQDAILVGAVNYQLDQVDGQDIFDPLNGTFGLVDLIGSGTITGGAGLNNGAFARSDIDATVNPIPEPATMALFGIGLLSIAAVGRRRN